MIPENLKIGVNMASSKDVNSEVLVPHNVIDLADEKRGVIFLNLRPTQWEQSSSWDNGRSARGHANYGDGELISNEFEQFLSYIKKPMRAILLYQHYRPEMYSVVVDLEPVICWTSDGLPRLEFDKPENWNHCPNMWGGFVLAVAQTKDLSPGLVVPDPTATFFCEIVSQHGIATPLPRINPRILKIPITQFRAFDHGHEVQVFVPRDWDVKEGDVLRWQANASTHGTVKAVRCKRCPDIQELECTFVKLT